MRRVHLGLIVLIAAVVGVAVFERPAKLADFDPARHAAFASTWDQRVHLAYWEKWGSFERDACQAMVDAFNESQSELFVHYVNTSEVDRKAMLAIIGHDPPDVVGLWAGNVQPFVAAGALLPLDDLMRAACLDPARYTPQYLEIGSQGGQTYALPTTPASVALFYNKDHFAAKAGALRAAGLDPERPPTTLEELDRYAEVLNEFNADGTPRLMGFLPTEPGWWNALWGYYFGGTLYDPGTDQVTPDAPANLEAMLWIKGYAERYGRDRLLQFRSGFGTFDSPNNAFIEGKVSMEMQGVWFPNFIRRHRPNLNFGVAPFPTARGVPGPVSYLDADVIAIPRGCRHPQEAWRFVVFAQQKGLEILCRMQGKHMPLRSPPALFRQGHPNLELPVFEAVAASPHSFIRPGLTVWREYQDELSRAFDHIWNYPLPEGALSGLNGPAAAARLRELCLPEIRATYAAVHENIQRKRETEAARNHVRAQREARRSGGNRGG